MRVRIGPYKNWFGPYQLAESLCFWAKEEKDEFGFPKTPDWVHNFGEWLAHGSVEPEPAVGEVRGFDRNRPTTWLYRFLLWIDSFRTRRVDIHIDRWDTWSMDHTLAPIILPMLRQLQETKHGAPLVDDEDVPEYLRSTAAEPKENEWDTDSNHFLRWDWVLGEMIFAFEKKCQDDWTSEFYSGESDILWVPVDRDGNEVPRGEHRYVEMRRGPNDTSNIDMEGMKLVQDRISNGFRLFGKYYEALWD